MPESSSLDIPFMGSQVLATMEETHVNFKVTPSDNPQLTYSLAVPKNWGFSKEFGPVPSGPFVTQGLGFFAASTRPGSPVIGVTVTPIPFEIPIDAWARISLQTEGWSIVSAKWFPGRSGLYFDVTGTRVVGTLTEVRRTTVRVDGSNIVSVNCLTSREHWDTVKEVFWAAHGTFELLGGTGTTRMEPWLSTSAKEPDFEVAYPFSWSAEPVPSPPPGVSAVDIRLTDGARETLLAYLQVKVRRLASGREPPKVERLLTKMIPGFIEFGFQSTGGMRPLTEAEDPRSGAIEGWLGGATGDGRLGDAEVTVRIGFLNRSDTVATILLFSPRREDDTLVALRAQRAFEIACSTLRIG